MGGGKGLGDVGDFLTVFGDFWTFQTSKFVYKIFFKSIFFTALLVELTIDNFTCKNIFVEFWTFQSSKLN